MPLKAPKSDERVREKFNEAADRWLGRAYLFLFLSLIFKAVGISFEKATFAGFDIKLTSPELIPGVFVMGILISYLVLIGGGLTHTILTPGSSGSPLRALIYWSTGPKRTLLGRTKSELRSIKILTRILLVIVVTAYAIVLFTPLVYALVNISLAGEALTLYFTKGAS